MDTTGIFKKLYGPFLAAVVFWLLAFTVQLPPGKTFEVSVPYIGIKVPVSAALVAKFLFCIAGFASVGSYAIADFSLLFPQHLTMQVFHDQDTIRRSLLKLEPYRIPRLIDSSEFSAAQQQYFEKVDQKINRSLNIPKFFTGGSDYIRSTGTSTTLVQKSKKGLQCYHVATSEGELTHILSLPGAPSMTLVTKNKKFDSGYDDLDFQVGHILHGLLLMTKYQQLMLYSRMEPGVEYEVLLIAATKIKVFPWPNISNTVYLAEEEHGLVPIAYAVFQ